MYNVYLSIIQPTLKDFQDISQKDCLYKIYIKASKDKIISISIIVYPRSPEPFYKVIYYNKMGQGFFDIQYFVPGP